MERLTKVDTNMTSELHSPAQALLKSRGYLIVAGVLSIFVGFFAMGAPFLFSVVIAQLLGAFALVSGVISLFLAIFGKHVAHRILDALSGVIRIAAGVALLICVTSGVAVITLILAIFLIIEGVSFILGALKMREHSGWVWTLISGIAALFLGLMIYARWPSDSKEILGLLFGINSLFSGLSLLMLGLGAKPKATA